MKRKTDADDAGKLARLAALAQINAVHIPGPAVRERQHLQEYRQALVAEQTGCRNRIRATLVLHGLGPPRGKTGWSTAARAELAEQRGRDRRRRCGCIRCAPGATSPASANAAHPSTPS